MNFTWRLIVSFGVLISLIVGLFALDAHFCKTEQLYALEKNTNIALKLTEAETIKTFQTFQMQQNILNKGLQLQILNIQKEFIEKEYWDFKRRVRDNPNDIELQNDFNDIKIQRQNIKDKIDKILLENN